MIQKPSSQSTDKYIKILATLNILGATLVVVLSALFSAVHSPLGQAISAGESPGFDWFRANIILCMGILEVYLIMGSLLQIKHHRQMAPGVKLLPLLICMELAGIALIALLIFIRQFDFLTLVLSGLLAVLLLPWLNNRKNA